MPDFTKNEIKKSFLKLLDEHPLSDITVKDIVEDCHINRSSFYYHFSDMSALIEEILKELADEAIRKFPTVDTSEQCLDAIMDFMLQHKRATMHIYRSVSRDFFERQLAKACSYFISSYTETLFEQLELNEAQKLAIHQYYKYLLLGFAIDWLDNGLAPEMAEQFRQITRFKGQRDIEILRDLH